MTLAENKAIAPVECTTIADVLSLQSSHICCYEFDMMVQHDGAVIIVQQSSGSKPKSSIEIPRCIFQKMIAWYGTPQ